MSVWLWLVLLDVVAVVLVLVVPRIVLGRVAGVAAPVAVVVWLVGAGWLNGVLAELRRRWWRLCPFVPPVFAHH